MRARPLNVLLCLLALCGLGAVLAGCGGGGASTGSTATPEATETAAAPETAEPGEAETAEPAETGAGGAPKVQTEPREEADTAADTAEIEAAIIASVEEKDPANCTAIEAPGFLEQTTGRSGPEALQACEEEAEAEAGKPPRETVKVSGVEAIGESAAANATISGGSLDGQTVEIALRKEGGRWRLGRLIGFRHFDSGAFVAAVGAVLADEGGEAAAARSCVEKGLGRLPRKELEDSILTGSAPQFQKAFEACQ